MGLENSWGMPDMTKVVPVGILGIAEVRHYQQTGLLAEKAWWWAIEDESIDEFKPEGVYAQLLVDGSVMMDDSPMERHTHSEFLANAHGHVLVGGLGLGMVTAGLLRKKSVVSVTVLDINQDVIDLVGPHIQFLATDKELRIILADVNSYIPDRDYDSVWMDIWPTRNPDNLAEMEKLKTRYASAKVVGCWYENELSKAILRTANCINKIANEVGLDPVMMNEAFARSPQEAEGLIQLKHGKRFLLLFGKYGSIQLVDTEGKDRKGLLSELFGFTQTKKDSSTLIVEGQIDALKVKAERIGMVLQPDLNAFPR